MIRRTWRLCAAAGLASAVPAEAAWLQATTRHFVVYADESPEAITKRATELELVDGAIRQFHAAKEAEGAEANRLTIFVTKGLDDLRRVYGNPNSSVAGFYIPRSSGSVAYTPASGMGRERGDLQPKAVLFHEYAHHFLLGNYAMAYPAWFSEGYAEFMSTLRVDPDQLVIGIAAAHRAYSLFFNDRALTIHELFAPPKKMDGAQVDSLYARGWLLTHYLLLDPERVGQFEKYLKAVNAGKPGLEAAREAFGDLSKMETAMNAYVMKRKLPARGIPRDRLPAPDVKVRALTPGEAAMIEPRMQSVRGVNSRTAATVLAAGTKVADRHPADAVVQGWYAEMAYDAGRDDLAEAAAARALAADPDQQQALLYKARILMRRALKAKATDTATWREIRAPIIRANKLSNDNAEALGMFYATYRAAGQEPSKNAVAALERAQQLVPQAPDLRYQLIEQYIRDDRIADARALLQPIAYDPHRGGGMPRRLLDAIDAKADRAALTAILEAPAPGSDKADTPPTPPPKGDGKKPAKPAG